ncbi:hypothetical protein DFH27DRAFT_526202 [Peziza echinospora]|nr:hypothetical protein DFH27DRAFT_526202 [Peziza echinospora]
MAPQSNAVAAGTTPPTANVPAAPSRRMASFRTFGWLRGAGWGLNAQTNAKKQEEVAKEVPAAIEETAAISSAIVPFQSPIDAVAIIEKEIERPPTRQYTPSSGMEISRSRVASPAIRDTSPFAGSETRSNNPPVRKATPRMYEDNEEYILNPPQEETADAMAGDENMGTTGGTADNGAGAAGMAKRGGGKLKLAALNILRRRSNSNVRREAEDEEPHGFPRRRGSVVGLQAYLTLSRLSVNWIIQDQSQRNSEKGGGFSRKGLFSPTLTLTQASPPGSQAPTRRTTRLQKAPPAELLRQRKSRTGSQHFDDSFAGGNSRHSGWESNDVRLSSSRSSATGALVLREENCAQLTPDATMITGGNAPGGLFPRPSSVKRNLSDGPQRSANGSPPGSAPVENGTASSGPRPLGFTPMNPYGTMKITEAASIETRVKELEIKAEVLYEFMNSLQTAAVQRRSSEPTTELSQSVRSQFREDTSYGKRPDTSNTMESFRNVNYSDASASVSTEGPRQRGNMGRRPPSPMEASSTSSYVSKNTRDMHERAFNHLRNFPASSTETDTASKRTVTNASMSTITPNHHHHQHHHHHDDRGQNEYRPKTPPPPGVPLEEFHDVLNLVKREQRARKKLERQIAHLTAQINMVQHHQLAQLAHQEHFYHHRNMGPAIGSSSYPAVSAAPSAASLRPGFQSLQRKTSSEVPTPDHTPPRGNGDLVHRQLFAGFDGVSAHDSDSDDDSRRYFGVDDDEDVWEVPSETARPSPTRNSNASGGVHLAPPHPTAAQKRTMSISQITEKASLAAAVRMKHHP